MSSKDYPQSEYDEVRRDDIAEGKYSERLDDGVKNEGKGGSDKKGGDDVEDSDEADAKLIEKVQEYFFGNEGNKSQDYYCLCLLDGGQYIPLTQLP